MGANVEDHVARVKEASKSDLFLMLVHTQPEAMYAGGSKPAFATERTLQDREADIPQWPEREPQETPHYGIRRHPNQPVGGAAEAL